MTKTFTASHRLALSVSQRARWGSLGTTCAVIDCGKVREHRRSTCEKHYQRQRLGIPADGMYDLGPCVGCGVTFRAMRRVQRWCSVECREITRKRPPSRRHDRLGGKGRRQVKDASGWHCYLCDRAIDPALAWPHPGSGTVDHVIPVAMGGTDAASNLRAAHWQCNQEKADNLPPWWVAA